MRFASIYSDDPEVRRVLLSAYAESLRTAHEENPATWSASLLGGGTYSNLVVGRIFVLSLKEDLVYITVDETVLSDEARTALHEAAAKERASDFKSLPEATWYALPPGEAARLWPLARAANLSAVRKAAKAVRRTPYKRAFSDELLDFMEGELDTELPRPVYESGGLTPERIKALAGLMNSYYPGWSGFDDPPFVSEEIEYKRRTVEKAADLLSRDALSELLEKKDYEEFLSRLEQSGKEKNLLYRAAPKAGDLNILYQDNLDRAAFCEAMFDLLHGAGDSPQRLGRYLDWVQRAGIPSKANKWTFPTYFLFFTSPDSDLFIKPTAVREFLKLGGFESGLSSKPTPEAYSDVRDAALELQLGLEEFGPSDMIDLWSFIFIAMTTRGECGGRGPPT
jgi:hypothetical protein